MRLAKAIVLGSAIRAGGAVISRTKWRIGGKKNYVSNIGNYNKKYKKKKRKY
jgi:hypothetical protein